MRKAQRVRFRITTVHQNAGIPDVVKVKTPRFNLANPPLDLEQRLILLVCAHLTSGAPLPTGNLDSKLTSSGFWWLQR
jgi:hypothetical protein